MIFHSPWLLLLLILIPPIFIYQRRFVKGGLKISSAALRGKLPVSLRQRLMFIPVLLQAAALVLVVIAAARPQTVNSESRKVSEGIAIELVVDRSGSMAAEMIYKGKYLNRLEIVKDVISDFIFGDGRKLGGRENDLIGLVSFARYADTNFPLSLSHGPLEEFINGVKIVTEESEDGTSIGDAVTLAAARLKSLDESDSSEEGYRIKSRIIILLTDGENNAGRRTPKEAAELAAEWGIKIYAVGIGGEESSIVVDSMFGAQRVPVGSNVDERTLKAAADISGGAYWTAGGAEAIREIYTEIDALEKSEVTSVEYTEYRELFSYFAASAIILIILRFILSASIFRRIP